MWDYQKLYQEVWIELRNKKFGNENHHAQARETYGFGVSVVAKVYTKENTFNSQQCYNGRIVCENSPTSDQ